MLFALTPSRRTRRPPPRGRLAFALALAVPVAALLAAGGALVGTPAAAAIRAVPAGYARVTDALAACLPGDTVSVAPGTYSTAANGEAFPLALGTAGVVLRGAGMGLSVLDAEDQASVVRLQAAGVRIEGFTLTGGRAANGGGVLVTAGDGTIARNLVLACGASDRGSGIFVAEGASATIHHNVVWQSYDTVPPSGGDPHGIQFGASNGTVEHNLIGRGDSNGLLNSGPTSLLTVRNNLFYQNGTPGVRGRGFCALGDSNTVIAHNIFWQNEIAAIIQFVNGVPVDMSGQEANDLRPGDGVFGNLDVDPALAAPDLGDWSLTPGSPAIDAGWPGSPPDPDGTVADIGPFFFDQATVGTPGGPGGARLALRAAPNPFPGRTQLAFDLPVAAEVRVTIHDVRGAVVARLFDGPLPAGPHGLWWDAMAGGDRPVPAGLYFARLEVAGRVAAQKLLLAR